MRRRRSWAVAAGTAVVAGVLVAGALIGGFGERTGGAPDDPAAAGHGSHLSCTGTPEAVATCRLGHYEELTRRSGPQAALAALAKESEVRRTSCHQLTHTIGKAAAERHQRIPDAFDEGRHLCGMGYYHGVVEAMVERLGRNAALAGVDSTCADLGQHGRRSAYHLGCAHGLGHGLMAVLDGQLFDSLAACDRLTDPWEQGHCQNGVFMENLHSAHPPGANHDQGGHQPAFLRAHEPLYPCTEVADRHKDQCLEKQTSYALSISGGDFARVFELCGTVAEPFRASCHRGLGRNAFEAAARAGAGEAEQVTVATQSCQLGPDAGSRSSCLAWTARYFVIFHGNTSRATVLCAGLVAEDRTSCTAAARDAEGLFLE